MAVADYNDYESDNDPDYREESADESDEEPDAAESLPPWLFPLKPSPL